MLSLNSINRIKRIKNSSPSLPNSNHCHVLQTVQEAKEKTRASYQGNKRAEKSMRSICLPTAPYHRERRKGEAQRTEIGMMQRSGINYRHLRNFKEDLPLKVRLC